MRTQDAFIPVGTSYVITDVGQGAYLSAAANVTGVSPTEVVEIELPFLRLPAITHGYSQAHHEGCTGRTENSLDSIQNNDLSRSFGVWKRIKPSEVIKNDARGGGNRCGAAS